MDRTSRAICFVTGGSVSAILLRLLYDAVLPRASGDDPLLGVGP